MKNSELRSVFISVNQSEHLSNDMVKQVSLDHMTHGDYHGNTKQLLKYVPTNEETELFNGHSKEYNKFAKADWFLYEIS